MTCQTHNVGHNVVRKVYNRKVLPDIHSTTYNTIHAIHLPLIFLLHGHFDHVGLVLHHREHSHKVTRLSLLFDLLLHDNLSE